MINTHYSNDKTINTVPLKFHLYHNEYKNLYFYILECKPENNNKTVSLNYNTYCSYSYTQNSYIS